MRAERITSTSDNCYILTETKPKTSSNKLKRLAEIVIIDSIQTLHTDYINRLPEAYPKLRNHSRTD
jgi:DNA repair protein RadA/Sms